MTPSHHHPSSLSLVLVVSAASGLLAGAAISVALRAPTPPPTVTTVVTPAPAPIALGAGAARGTTGVTGSLGAPIAPPCVTQIVAAPRAAAAGARTLDIAAVRSPRAFQIDEMSALAFAPDGSPDDVFDLDVDMDTPIKNVFVTWDAEGHQWDTVVGDATIEIGSRFELGPGRVTWHVGVRENGQWLNGADGGLRAIPPGKHHLELVATSPQPSGPRVITVELADGTFRAVRVR